MNPVAGVCSAWVSPFVCFGAMHASGLLHSYVNIELVTGDDVELDRIYLNKLYFLLVTLLTEPLRGAFRLGVVRGWLKV